MKLNIMLLTGNLVAWVRIPVLSPSGNTVIRMLYGNPQAITNPSSKDVWNSDYAGVWHLQNTNDATVNNIIGTPFGGPGVNVLVRLAMLTISMGQVVIYA